jgi:uncharacterized protein (TIGR02246 family)
MRPLVSLLIVGSLCAPLAAQSSESPDAAIRAAIDSYVAAYNSGDVEAVLNHWADDAEYLLATGERVQGREALRAVFADCLAGENRATIEVLEPHVRLLSDTVATEESVARITRPGETLEETSYLAIYVKQGDAWKLTTVRETAVEPEPVAPAHEQLSQLGWLVGRWVDQSDAATVTTNVRWSGNGAFLVYSFKAETPGLSALEGTQIIGWDPAREVIHSWLFDSDGGFGEGDWLKDGDRWVVAFRQTLPDGGQATATNVYRILDENNFQWHSFNRTVDGEPMPNIDDVTIVRVAETETAPAAPTTPTEPAADTTPTK